MIFAFSECSNGLSPAAAPGKKYHVISGSMGASHFIIVDGQLVTYFADKNFPDPKRPGHFGFGIYESCAEYSNLTVWRPHWTDIGERKYEPGTVRAAAQKKRAARR